VSSASAYLHRMSTEGRPWLRGRRWTIGDTPPVRFPAWRVWVDSRVRLDDAVLDTLAGMDLAVVALNERATEETELIPDIFTPAELPFGKGFSVSVDVARRRLLEAEQQMALNAFPIYVAGFDALLGETIRLLRRLGVDTSDPDRTDTGMSAKAAHLRTHAGVVLEPAHERLYDLLLAIRHSVIHHGSTQAPVAKAWNACLDGGPGQSPQAIWSAQAGGPLPLEHADGRLRFSDREVVGCQRVLDAIAIDLAAKLRRRITPVDWARLVAATEGPLHPGILTDPTRRVGKLRAWTTAGWGVEIDDEMAEHALAEPLP
jgi:hypothetical protein